MKTVVKDADIEALDVGAPSASYRHEGLKGAPADTASLPSPSMFFGHQVEWSSEC